MELPLLFISIEILLKSHCLISAQIVGIGFAIRFTDAIADGFLNENIKSNKFCNCEILYYIQQRSHSNC
ncbi:MAG: hypothetical protein ACYTXC_23125 [Nostoc sp.]